jgi:type IV fimbrial biogenesis protein FimT
LIELMVGLAVMALLMMVAVPSFQSTIASSRVTTVTNDLVGSLAAARTEAIRRGVRVTVCASADGASCATDWSQGWMVFTDSNRNADWDSGETILAITAKAPGGITVKGDGNAASFVSYSPDGQPKGTTGSPLSGSRLQLQVCSDNAQLSDARRARLLEINLIGRLVTTTPPSTSATCDAPT